MTDTTLVFVPHNTLSESMFTITAAVQGHFPFASTPQSQTCSPDIIMAGQSPTSH